MLITGIGTASWLELIHTLLALLALLGWVHEAVDIRRQARTQSREAGYATNGPKARLHRGAFAGALLQILFLTFLVSIGVSAILTPPPLMITNQVQATRGGLLFIGADLIMLLYIANQRNTRRQVNRALDREARRLSLQAPPAQEPPP
jgi:hypothetical protein